MTVRTAIEVLAETVSVTDRDVLDVGCGAGEIVRWAADQGARVTGAECGEVMRAMAVKADPDHVDRYVDAVGENLPFADASFDLLIYSYSLHHVPIDLIPDALREARRVLRPGGTLYVVEPEPNDPDDTVGYPVSDERPQLARAQALLAAADRFGFRREHTSDFDSEGVYADFDAWADMLVGIDPDRAELMEQHREQVREQFYRLGQSRAGGWVFPQVNKLVVFTAV